MLKFTVQYKAINKSECGSHTAPGPLTISMSYFRDEQEPWIFMINFGFLLFNDQLFM